MAIKNLTYEQPGFSTVLIEVEGGVLGDDKSEGGGGGSTTEPIDDPGNSHGWS